MGVWFSTSLDKSLEKTKITIITTENGDINTHLSEIKRILGKY